MTNKINMMMPIFLILIVVFSAISVSAQEIPQEKDYQ
jgi:ABC-type Na+ efflux pump permease subunit